MKKTLKQKVALALIAGAPTLSTIFGFSTLFVVGKHTSQAQEIADSCGYQAANAEYLNEETFILKQRLDEGKISMQQYQNSLAEMEDLSVGYFMDGPNISADAKQQYQNQKSAAEGWAVASASLCGASVGFALVGMMVGVGAVEDDLARQREEDSSENSPNSFSDNSFNNSFGKTCENTRENNFDEPFEEFNK